jgi:hypothetical protein
MYSDIYEMGSSDHLVIDFPALARVYRQQTSANGLRVSYQKHASQ